MLLLCNKVPDCKTSTFEYTLLSRKTVLKVTSLKLVLYAIHLQCVLCFVTAVSPKEHVKCLCIMTHHLVLLLLVEHRASMKSFQVLRSLAVPLTSFHYLPVLLISASVVLRHVLYSLPLLQCP
jgi:hypothetical protein